MTRFGVMTPASARGRGPRGHPSAGPGEAALLNPVPIRLIHDRWIDKYTERRVSALAELKHELEGKGRA